MTPLSETTGPSVFQSVPALGAGSGEPGDFERRRSDRFIVDIPTRLDGAELVSLVELSLGGATLEMSIRPTLLVPHRLTLGHEGAVAELTVVPYRSWIYELFYHPKRGSQVRYRTRVTFQEPSVAALNLVYRILFERWSANRPPESSP
jgi:hypothetical protein